jgi:importin subunit alpha-1
MLGNRGEMIVNRLCEILNANLSHLESPTVRILGNLATATDEITDLVMKTDGIKFICKMLASTTENTRKEAAWTVSNFTAGTVQQTEVVYDLGVFQQCFKMLKEDTHQVQVEVAYVLSNAPNKLNENLNRKLVAVGLMDAYI